MRQTTSAMKVDLMKTLPAGTTFIPAAVPITIVRLQKAAKLTVRLAVTLLRTCMVLLTTLTLRLSAWLRTMPTVTWPVLVSLSKMPVLMAVNKGSGIARPHRHVRQSTSHVAVCVSTIVMCKYSLPCVRRMTIRDTSAKMMESVRNIPSSVETGATLDLGGLNIITAQRQSGASHTPRTVVMAVPMIKPIVGKLGGVMNCLNLVTGSVSFKKNLGIQDRGFTVQLLEHVLGERLPVMVRV